MKSIVLNKKLMFLFFFTLISVGKLNSDFKINFFSNLIWEVFLIPFAVIVFWADFFRILPRTDSKKIKLFPKAFIIIAIYTVFYNFWCFYYIADIPNLLKKNYVCTIGTVSYVSVKNRIKNVQYFEIDDRVYWNFADDFIKVKKWEKYKITTLKNTKQVINIERVEK